MIRILFLLTVHFASLSLAGSAEAYIGPGAGFAFLSSFFVLAVSFLLAIFSLLFWPFRWLARKLLRRRSKPQRQIDRVVILGLDGLDPRLTEQFMAGGKLPHFQRLKEMGSFSPLATSYPSISPAAWSSFMTGVDCSHHNIFDFLTRDPRTYLPMLSSAEIGPASRTLSLGKYRIPLGKPKVKLLRKSKPFWTILGENDIFSSIIRVPITFPPEKFKGVLLSGMCTPDLRGTQGTFSYYTTRKELKGEKEGGVCIPVVREGHRIRTFLQGPENDFHKDGGALKIPLDILVDEERNQVQIRVSGQRFYLEHQSYSPWIKVKFAAGLGSKVHGICRFYLNQITPELDLYATPVQIDPERPALPISHPFIYSVYLAKLISPYGTLGLAEDTWALNEGVIDEEGFLKQAYLYCQEREEMFSKALEKTPKGLCVCVFDTPDRIQHMFFRCLDENHPANKNKETARYRGVIEEMYQQMDALLGRLMKKLDEKTVLMVMSDHGFAPFRRGFNINTWLLQNGYLALKRGKLTSGEWFADVDWQHTKAFSLGLTGLFINKKGRESQGIVGEGEDSRHLKRELITKLTGLVDGETGEIAIRGLVDAEESFSGPYLDNGPDLLIGYNSGYRTSWDCASGRVTSSVFEDNTKRWSGDHCIDPKLVPGVFFCNQAINGKAPDIRDIAPTVLKLFGVEVPHYMDGEPLIPHGN
ncbi:MAG: alkaline phosphatase family protein [Deltaproteobacteria bacterium]|nr:alkaline phosphatase family protein [Deltaproteobacteria bacterium]